LTYPALLCYPFPMLELFFKLCESYAVLLAQYYKFCFDVFTISTNIAFALSRISSVYPKKPFQALDELFSDLEKHFEQFKEARDEELLALLKMQEDKLRHLLELIKKA